MMRKFCLFAAIVGAVFCAISNATAGNSGWIGAWWNPIDAQNYEQAWGMNPDRWSNDAWGMHFDKNDMVRVQLIASNATGNIFWPGEEPELTLQFENLTDQRLSAKGDMHLYQYGMSIGMKDMWKQELYRIADCGTTPITIDLPANGFQNITVKPSLPDKFGAYALIVALEGQDRVLGALLTRTIKAQSGRVQYPVMSLDETDPATLERLGIKAVRVQLGWTRKSNPNYEKRMAELKRRMEEFKQHNITVIVWIGESNVPQPLGGKRGIYLNKEGEKGGVWDTAWLPKSDGEFENWIADVAGTYGWPKGPINAFHLWNEPWEGGSISGWGADCLRYREIYARMAYGIQRARRESGVEVLTGGCDSSSNARDKLFCDGGLQFLPSFDFLSIHYQAMSPDTTQKIWVDRTPRVRFWDTESWIANSEGQVASSIAVLRSAGYDRVLGMMVNNIAYEKDVEVCTERGREKRTVVQSWPLAPAVAACSQLLGERPFRQLLFKNGLPWVMVFDGLTGDDGTRDPEDGTVVIVGDIGAVFGGDWPDFIPFRTARSFSERAVLDELRAKLAALPENATEEEHRALQEQIDAKRPLTNCTFTIAADERYNVVDPYGNSVAPKEGRYVIPLNSEGYFLRGNGKKGAFTALLGAIRKGRIEGLEPLAKGCCDMRAPVGQQPTLRLKLTNVLNRPVEGSFSVKLGELQVQAPATISFGAHETKEIPVRIIGGAPVPSNTYPLTMMFDAGADGISIHHEDMHCNVIASRTVTIDGSLDDWQGTLPQIINDAGESAPTMTEACWWPMRNFDSALKKGTATGYVAADENYFYFAAKIADSTPDPGMPRFATFDADQCFHPEVVYQFDKNNPDAPKAELVWPKGVRRFTYWQAPILPSGSVPAHDNIQIAFQAFPPDSVKKDAYPCPPGTMFGYTTYHDSDYIYALNPVAPNYGGGTEIWRLKVPGMPRKHFYPRQPSSPLDGPVAGGKLAITRDGNTRIVECAVPWSEIPEVKRKRDAGEAVKFSFRVNDNAGTACMELARERSVSKRNSATFRNDWEKHWANEVEFGWEK